MHLIIHTQYYPPEIGAPQNRLHELASLLKQKGIDVTILTAMPNYPQGHVYDGYGGWMCVDILDGIKVIRTAIYPSQSASFIPRLLSYFSFVFSSLMVGIWQIGKADFVFTESPPIFLGITGVLLSHLKGARWIFNISDLWPESAVELGVISRESLAYRISSILEQFLYRQASFITGQSHTILENIEKRFSGVRTYHLSNGVDTSFFIPNSIVVESRNFRVVYAGLHGLAQGLEQLIFAAHEITVNHDVDFILLGDGPDKVRLTELATYLNLHNVHFLAPVVKEKVIDVIKDADVLIVPLKIQLTGAVPSKLYEAMAVGKPVILIAQSEAAEIVMNAQCGLVVQPGDIASFVDAIVYLKSHPEQARQMGQNGRRVVCQNYDRAKIADEFAKFLLHETRNKNEI